MTLLRVTSPSVSCRICLVLGKCLAFFFRYHFTTLNAVVMARINSQYGDVRGSGTRRMVKTWREKQMRTVPHCASDELDLNRVCCTHRLSRLSEASARNLMMPLSECR